MDRVALEDVLGDTLGEHQLIIIQVVDPVSTQDKERKPTTTSKSLPS